MHHSGYSISAGYRISTISLQHCQLYELIQFRVTIIGNVLSKLMVSEKKNGRNEGKSKRGGQEEKG